jgi:hypothetical protein
MAQAALHPAEEFPMSLSQQIEVHNDYLNVVISGDFSLTELIALAKEMYAAIIQHNITKLEFRVQSESQRAFPINSLLFSPLALNPSSIACKKKILHTLCGCPGVGQAQRSART